jgi:hypothetical protein
VQSQLEANSTAVARQLDSRNPAMLQQLRSAATADNAGMLDSTWKIEASELKICMQGGQPVVLGSGGFGKVSCLLYPCIAYWPSRRACLTLIATGELPQAA